MTDIAHESSEFHVVRIDEILRISGILAGMEWLLSIDCIDELVKSLKWCRHPNDEMIDVSTGLPVNRPDALFIDEDGAVNEIIFFVADFLLVGQGPSASRADRSLVIRTFEMIRGELSGAYGPWSSGRGAKAWWDLASGGRLKLNGQSMAVSLSILSPKYADVERAEERLGISPDRVLGEDE